MGSFAKKIGMGILYIFVLPVLLVVLAVYGTFGLLLFIFLGIKALVLFFKGESLFDDLPEDKLAKAAIERINQQPVVQPVFMQVNQNPQPFPNQVYPQPQNPYENIVAPQINETNQFPIDEKMEGGNE